MTFPDQSYVAGIATGGAGVTAPLWLDLIDPAYQSLVALIGFAILVVTLRNKILDLRIKRLTLRALHGEEAARMSHQNGGDNA